LKILSEEKMLRTFTFLVLCLGLIPFSSLASPVTPLYTDTVTFNGYPYGLHDGQLYVGNASFESEYNDLGFIAWCITRGQSQVPAGDSYRVNVFKLDDTDLPTLLGVTYTQLRMMAILGLGFNNTNPNDTMRQHAIWAQGRPDLVTLTPDEQALAMGAFAMAPWFDDSDVYVALPADWGVPGSQGQGIMWTGDGSSQVPEPGTMALFGLGAVGLGVASRKRKL
jgi:hypothetical protein